MRAAAGKLLEATYGKKRWQPLWQWAYRQSLLGQNFGRSAVADSGELHALDHARSVLPDARVLLDVGANQGAWSVAAANAGRGTDSRFRAGSASFTALGNTVDERVTCVRAAVGDAAGTATLYAVQELFELSSLHSGTCGGAV
jgi:hypothetical protein